MNTLFQFAAYCFNFSVFFLSWLIHHSVIYSSKPSSFFRLPANSWSRRAIKFDQCREVDDFRTSQWKTSALSVVFVGINFIMVQLSWYLFVLTIGWLKRAIFFTVWEKLPSLSHDLWKYTPQGLERSHWRFVLMRWQNSKKMKAEISNFPPAICTTERLIDLAKWRRFKLSAIG